MLPRAADLFAGCGGLSLGLRNAGFRIGLANEIDHSAAGTYAANHGEARLLVGDIRDVPREVWRSLRGQVELISGGPPCQGFSVTGRRQYGEIPDHNTLVEAFLDVVSDVAPPLVLMENVAGFRTAKLRPGVRALTFTLQRLADMGYRTYEQTVQAADFGVPSLRSRIFVIAVRDAFPFDPFSELAAASGRSHIGCLDAISDLPDLAAGQGVDEPVPYPCPALNDYQLQMRLRSPGVANHVAMRHSPRLIARFATIQPGSSSYRLTGEKVTVYKSNNQRLQAEVPSLCITANFQSNYIHPLANRNLTAREAARLMTFPDRFLFRGKRTLMSRKFLEKYDRIGEIGLSQYNQIGNSVPPKLAEALGEVLLKIIKELHGIRDRAA